MHDKLTVAESWWSGPGNEFLSATVSLSSTNCGPRRHQSSSLYERPSEQGLEWALKPPLQTLYGWRRNAAVVRFRALGLSCAREGLLCVRDPDQNCVIFIRMVAGIARGRGVVHVTTPMTETRHESVAGTLTTNEI